jgi:hypothetical protein
MTTNLVFAHTPLQPAIAAQTSILLLGVDILHPFRMTADLPRL